MRYAILSDLHANRQALSAVLADVQAAGADRILCLGDVAGYGPSPAEVLAEAHSRIHHFVLGNHDAVLAGSLDPGCFTEHARQVIEWTRRQLGPRAAKFFSVQPLVLAGPGFRCVHGDFTDPAAFRYVVEPDDATACWAAVAEPLLFTGHTHLPGLFVTGASGRTHALPPQDFQLEAGKRYLVNVGSVGQPRDADRRASWVLFDDAAKTVFFRRVAFDWAGFKQDLDRAGLPPGPARFLEGVDARPFRERTDFRPVRREAGAKPPAIKVETLHAALASARRWRRIGLLLATVLLLAGAALAVLLPRWRGRPAMTEWAALETTELAAMPAGTELLRPPETAGVLSAHNRLHDWTVRLAKPGIQQVTAGGGDTADDGAADLRVVSGEPADWELLCRPVPVAKGDRFTLSVQVKTEAWRNSRLTLALVERFPDGSETVLEQKEFRKPESPRWETVKFTLAKNGGGVPRSGRVCLSIRGRLDGAVLLRRASLKKAG